LRIGPFTASIALSALAIAAAGCGAGGAGGGSQRTPIPSSAFTEPLGQHPPPPVARAAVSREHAAVARLISSDGYVIVAGSRQREIALTFDDGPGPYTPRLLDELARLRVSATFFEIGSMLPYFHRSMTRELALGDVVGDHTQLHVALGRLSERRQRKEIVTQMQEVSRYGGPRPILFRPPDGSFNSTTFRVLKRLHLLMVLWTVDTEDYRQPGVRSIVHAALAGARPGAIILMHDAGGRRTQTIAALRVVVRDLRRRHFKLVTVPQLLLDDPPSGRLPTLHHDVDGG
jgi:peptidoglycan/xylan/chitin deacetylase (PgdA/CDA1 family)